MEFKESKKFGNIGEFEILKNVIRKYPQAYIDDRGKANSDWDVFIPEKDYGIEVKMDYKSLETGNLLIEVEMNGKLSALSKTKSRFWVFITGIRLIWITPLEIYRFLEQNPNYTRVSLTGNGDTKQKFAYLVKHDEFINYIYDNFSKEEQIGWVEMIKEKSVLYKDNMFNLMEMNEEDFAVWERLYYDK